VNDTPSIHPLETQTSSEPTPLFGNEADSFVQQLRLAAAIVFTVSSYNIGDICRVFIAELFGTPLLCITRQIFCFDLIRVPGIVEKKGNGKFHGFEITHVDDPYLPGLVFPGQVHLFPYPCNGICV